MIEIKEKADCCGCEACIQACPKACITMEEDSEGFCYPQVDLSSCINCGACEKVCPIINAKETGNKVLESYIAYSADEDTRIRSSSGGIFSLLAENVIKQGGVVFGVTLNDALLAQHICVNNIEGLEKLRGSKYIQSRIENTFQDVKEKLSKDILVLYTGTPCQIAGLKQYLKRDYDNLLTVDILCHGVPSIKVWKKYIREQEKTYGAEVENVNFRNKIDGWKNYAVELQFKNSKVYRKVAKEDLFMKLFLGNICLRPSCYSCRFKNLERASDITIGDCWGVQKYMPSMDDDKGTSLLLIHTDKGKNFFEKIASNLVYQKVERIDDILPESADSRKSVIIPYKRVSFFQCMNEGANIEKLEAFVEVPMLIRIKKKIKRIISNIFMMK